MFIIPDPVGSRNVQVIDILLPLEAVEVGVEPLARPQPSATIYFHIGAFTAPAKVNPTKTGMENPWCIYAIGPEDAHPITLTPTCFLAQMKLSRIFPEGVDRFSGPCIDDIQEPCINIQV